MIILETDKKENYEENDNIYKNDLDFNEEDYEVDAETIEINDDADSPAQKKQEESSANAKKAAIQRDDDNEEKDKPVASSRPMKKVSKPIKPVVTRKAKKITKKTNSKPSKSPKKPSNSNGETAVWPWIVLIIVIVTAAAVLIWSIVTHPPQQQTAGNNTVVATVNGEQITLGEINARYDSLNPFYKSVITKELLLNQSIDELLLLQEAEKEGLTATDQEVEDLINSILEESNMSYDDFVSRLASQGISIDYVRSVYKNQMIIDKVLNQTVFKGIEVSEQEIENYYEENKDLFTGTPDQAKVRHILVAIDNYTTLELASEKINEAKNKYLSEEEDFCSLVAEYSDDAGSIASCGEYTFPRGQMVPEFENAAFELEPNQTEIVQSVYGYHFIEKLEDIPGTVASFESLRDQIEQTLLYQKQEESYMSYIKTLRDSSAITANYDALEAEAMEEQAETTGNVVTEPIENVIGEDQETSDQSMQEENSVQQEQTSEQQETMNEQQEIQDETQNEDSSMIENTEELRTCLAATDAVLYGAYWKKEVKEQKDMLGDVFDVIEYVECDPNYPDSQPEKCSEKEIDVYPTWIIKGEKSEGKKTLQELKELALC